MQVVTLNQDIRAENFCLTALDQSVFRYLEIPLACTADKVIPQHLGVPVLCDFGKALST